MAKANEYSGEMEPPRVRTKERTFRVMFTQNRTFELHVGGAIITFLPNGVQVLPASVVDHPDFKQVAGYFAVTEA